jgi:subtilase family serine protease
MFEVVRKSYPVVRVAGVAVLAAVIVTLSLSAFAQSSAQVLGPEDPNKQINVTYWLNQHNQAEFDALVHQLYDPSSPKYHQWLTPQQYQARYAPSAADMAIVQRHLADNNLQVVNTDKFNHAVTARGTVRDIQRATGMQINRALINGEERRAGSGQLAISGPAGKVVYAVEGLTDTRFKNFAARPIDPETGKPFAMVPLSKVKPETIEKYWNANCLQPAKTLHLTTPGDKSGPYETYTGTIYNDKPLAGPPNLWPCGYNSIMVQRAYGMPAAFEKHLNGNGQNIVIVDAYGDDTILSDANAFSSINNLPQLTSANFGIFYPTGPTSCGNGTGAGCGWDGETALDVEWSHTMAPKANIALVLAADASSTNLDLALLFAVETGLGPVVSNSWGGEEFLLIEEDPGELIVENNINKTAAALGVSVNFATGDSGDDLAADKVITVNMPASSPYATAVGGTSLFLNPDFTMKLQTGWGTNITRIASYSSGCGQSTCDPVLTVPVPLGYIYGAGGGASAYWPKPSFQASLSGSNRLLPDIGFLADPYTGVEVVLTENGKQGIGVIGGTSLATPMFSGVWAVATQAAGKWLGQASARVYKLPASAITDVTDVVGPEDVSGLTDQPPATPVNYSAQQLMAPLENTVNFVSSMYQGATSRWYSISFGTDSSLTTGPGWDNVTGLGTPNGLSFITAAAAK